MMNRAINHLVLATVDSLTKFKKKLAYYLAIFAMVFGSTFGTMNSANAADVPLANDSVTTTFEDTDDAVVNGLAVTFDLAGSDQMATITNTVDTTVTLDAVGALTITGDITGATTKTMALSIIQGTTILGGSIIETVSGVVTLNIGASDEFNTTGTAKAIAAAITSTDATGILDIDGTATFSDTVQAGVITIADTTIFSSTLTNTGLMTISGGTTVNGVLTGTGAVNIDAATTLNANASFNSADETLLASTLTFKGATLTATGTNGIETDDGAAKIVIDAAAGDQTIAAQITPDTTNEAILENSNVAGTVTFNEKIGTVGGFLMELIDTHEGATSVFKKEVGAVLFTVDGTATITLDDNQATNIDLAGKLIIDDTITNGQKVFTLNTDLVATSVAGTNNIKMPANLSNGQALELFETVSAGGTGAAGVVVTVDLALADTALRSYKASVTGTRDITVTATDRSAADVGTQLGATKNVGTALLQATIAASTEATALDAFSNALNAEGGFSATEDTALALQVAPQTDTIGGSSLATRAMTGSLQGIMSNRMASLRSGDAFVTGMSAGNGMSVNSGFIQAFGSEAEQKNTGTTTAKVYGYDSQTSGVAIGFDGMTETGETIGLSASYSSTDVDGKGTGKSKNAIDSYTVSVYADKATENGYIEGSLTYGINDNTSSRLVNTAGLSRTYKGDYDSEQISLKVGGGVPNEVKDGTFVTPFASATGTLITTDSYTETSTTASDALRLKIAQDDINSLVGTIGVKAHMITDKGTPMISFAINNEFGDTTINSTNTYTGGGTAFNTSTDVEELSVTLGLGYSFGNDVTSLNIGYEANANEDDYLSHYGTVKIISKF